VSDAKGEEEFEFEPIEEQPETDALEGELAPLDEGELPPLDGGLEEAEAGEAAEPPPEEAGVAEGPELLEEEAAFVAEEEAAAPAAEDEEDAAEEEEEEEEKQKKPGLIEVITSASPYTVMLIVAFVALLLGILCLASELGRYEWDFKAKEAKRGRAMGPALYRPVPSSTAAACPTAEKLSFSAAGAAPSNGAAWIT